MIFCVNMIDDHKMFRPPCPLSLKFASLILGILNALCLDNIVSRGIQCLGRDDRLFPPFLWRKSRLNNDP